MKRRNLLKWSALAASGAASLLSRSVFAQAKGAAPKELRVDYAYYSPTSLVLKKFGWLEEAVKPQGTEVKWVLSAGSNRALEYLASDSVDFGSTAGLAALLARANGNPIRSVYVCSRPEWTALAVAKNSPIQKITELKGQKIAATLGTDPYLFLLRSLSQAGLHKNDVEIVPLQHADGRIALERGDVAAWAGLDPHLAASELEAGSRIIYHNINFNTYAFLDVSEKFANAYPEQVPVVIQAYERARKWAIANPGELAKILAEESKLSLAVAERQLKRTDFSNPLIGAEHREALAAASPILTGEALVKQDVDLAKVLSELIDPAYALRAGLRQA